MSSLIQWFLLLSLLGAASGYKILVYNPQMGHSHVTFFGHIADTLSKAGHDVTVYLPAFNDQVNITGVKLARTIVRPRDFELPFDLSWFVSDVWTKPGDSLSQIIKMMQFMFQSQVTMCDAQFADADLIRRLKEEKFDLGIVEVYSTCGFALLDKIGIPAQIAGLATTLVEQVTLPFGIENNPSFVPGGLSGLSDEMSYLERLRNFATTIASKILMRLVIRSQEFYEGLIPGFNLRQKIGASAFFFVNADEFTEFPRPINHKVVYIGGIGVQEAQPLPQEYETLLEQSSGPVVLISFGSVASSSKMPENIKVAFVEMMAALPEVTFIWKYELDDNVATNLSNVIKKKWVPQNDLLNHPKVTAFVSHGGLNSITESTHAGVPMVCVPLFGDQMRNARMIEKRGVGHYLDKQRINGPTLTGAVKRVLYTKSYKRAAKRLADMIRKKPMSAQERVVRYAEFAAEYKETDNLLPSCTKLNFFQYYLLDIILPFLAALVISASAIIYILVRLTQKCLKLTKIKVE